MDNELTNLLLKSIAEQRTINSNFARYITQTETRIAEMEARHRAEIQSWGKVSHAHGENILNLSRAIEIIQNRQNELIRGCKFVSKQMFKLAQAIPGIKIQHFDEAEAFIDDDGELRYKQ